MNAFVFGMSKVSIVLRGWEGESSRGKEVLVNLGVCSRDIPDREKL